MKLKDWLKKNKITQKEFAERLGVSLMSVTRYCKEDYDRIPPNRKKQIFALTDGEVAI